MKKQVLLSLVVLFALALASCAPAAAPAPTFSGEIKVANLSPLSGPVPTFGESTTNGFNLAVEEWNAKGGVLGMKIIPIVEDSQCTADPAVNAANKVIDQDGVKFIVGEVCSSASIPISLIAEEKGVVQISPTSTNPALTVNLDGSTKQYIFRACFTDDFQGWVMAKYVYDEGKRTAFTMADKGNDYVLGLAAVFAAEFEKMGGKIVGKETYTGTDTDFSVILTKVADSGAEVLYIPDYYNVVNLVAAQAKEKGVTALLRGGDGWDSPDLNLVALEGGVFSNHYSPDEPRALVQNYVKAYKEKYDVIPDALATLAYDATSMLFAAIEKAGVDDPAVVKDMLATMKHEVVSGSFILNAQHNPVKPAFIIKIEGGKTVFVEQIYPVK